MGIIASGNEIFFAGGQTSYSGTTTSKIDVYNTNTLTWRTLSLSVARKAVAVAAVGNYVAFAGGQGTYLYNTVDIYSTSDNQWSTKSLSSTRYGAVGLGVGSKMVFVGGYDDVDDAMNDVDIFDTSNSFSRTVTTFPIKA